MSCGLAHLDGAYVLGALSPADRQEFERHLAGCMRCSTSLQQLAGLPGLLARVEADVWEPDGPASEVPPTVLPALVRDVRRSQRRRTFLTAGLAAAAAAVVAVGSLSLAGLVGRDAPEAPPVAADPLGDQHRMVPVTRSPVSAEVAMAPVGWGTQVALTCSYDPDATSSSGTTYVMVVHTRDGHTRQVATWRSVPGKTVKLTASTAVVMTDIASVEVLLPDGRPALEFTI